MDEILLGFWWLKLRPRPKAEHQGPWALRPCVTCPCRDLSGRGGHICTEKNMFKVETRKMGVIGAEAELVH